MKAWTVKQPFASLIVMGAMPYWFDKDIVPGRLIGERVVVYADAEPVNAADVINLYENIYFEQSAGTRINFDIAALFVGRLREDVEQGRFISRVPLGVSIGTIVLGLAVAKNIVFPDDAEIESGMFAWPLSEPDQFPRPIRTPGPVSGFWDWPSKGERS